MSLYLIHLRPGIGPLGVWVQRADGELDAYYGPDTPRFYRHRAAQAIAARGHSVPFPVWARRLSDRTPYFDDYATTVADADTPLAEILAEACRHWH